MKLPDWTDSGLFPLGMQQADLSGIYERLLLDARHRDRPPHHRIAITTGPEALLWL